MYLLLHGLRLRVNAHDIILYFICGTIAYPRLFCRALTRQLLVYYPPPNPNQTPVFSFSWMGLRS